MRCGIGFTAGFGAAAVRGICGQPCQVSSTETEQRGYKNPWSIAWCQCQDLSMFEIPCSAKTILNDHSVDPKKPTAANGGVTLSLSLSLSSSWSWSLSLSLSLSLLLLLLLLLLSLFHFLHIFLYLADFVQIAGQIVVVQKVPECTLGPVNSTVNADHNIHTTPYSWDMLGFRWNAAASGLFLVTFRASFWAIVFFTLLPLRVVHIGWKWYVFHHLSLHPRASGAVYFFNQTPGSWGIYRLYQYVGPPMCFEPSVVI